MLDDITSLFALNGCSCQRLASARDHNLHMPPGRDGVNTPPRRNLAIGDTILSSCWHALSFPID